MNNFSREDFGNDFHWGVSIAAYQNEGAYNTEGKGLSIWDDFTHRRNKILGGQNADISCDFYHRFKEDLRLMRAMNIPNFRLSIAWSRIFPNGTGQVNSKGVDFYNQVIDYCLELGIEPWITLYHWDLPLALEQRGGWTDRAILSWFEEYVSFCAKTFGDRVKHWMVLNEPMVFTGVGYFLGLHAPSKKGMKNFLKAAHHATLAQGVGGRALRFWLPKAHIGTTYSCTYVEPHQHKGNDINAAYRVDALLNRLFLEPTLGLGYPINSLGFLKKIEKYFDQDDEQNLPFEFDFIGIQYYTREKIRHAWFSPYISSRVVSAQKRNMSPITEMGWEVYPKGINKILHQFSQYKNIPSIIITENGAAFPDAVENQTVNDTLRTGYLQSHIQQVLKAKQEGVNVQGYFVWTFTDNFEWAEGYKPRFGLVHVDFKTQERLIKNSGKWYAQFLENNIHTEIYPTRESPTTDTMER